jgi:hypothetical protein
MKGGPVAIVIELEGGDVHVRGSDGAREAACVPLHDAGYQWDADVRMSPSHSEPQEASDTEAADSQPLDSPPQNSQPEGTQDHGIEVRHLRISASPTGGAVDLEAVSDVLNAAGVETYAYRCVYSDEGPLVHYEWAAGRPPPVDRALRDWPTAFLYVADFGWDCGTWFFGAPTWIRLAHALSSRFGLEVIAKHVGPQGLSSFAVEAGTDEPLREELLSRRIVTECETFRPTDW